ncbi:hypothetical protein LIMNO130_50076 [Limnobacter sp. 130]|nr:hypothetical protein LIMNO130_50076 [Limnobacter sp. 130]
MTAERLGMEFSKVWTHLKYSTSNLRPPDRVKAPVTAYHPLGL